MRRAYEPRERLVCCPCICCPEVTELHMRLVTHCKHDVFRFDVAMGDRQAVQIV